MLPYLVQLSTHSKPDGTMKVLPWLVLFMLVVCAALMWFGSMPIARLVTRDVSPDISFGVLSLVDGYSIAFMTIGLFYAVNALPQTLNRVCYLFMAAASHSGDAWKQDVNWYQMAQVFIPFIAGVALFVKSRRWAVVLARRQTTEESLSASTSQNPEADA
ncbi:MAG TPA: hypothetical protein VGO57_02465 [Verrucomicrobiae bacterium]